VVHICEIVKTAQTVASSVFEEKVNYNHTFTHRMDAIMVSKWNKPSVAVSVGKHNQSLNRGRRVPSSMIRFGQVRGQFELPRVGDRPRP